MPATMLMAARLALSSESQADSWPGNPTARSSANSVTRSRADTAAFTTKPRIANTAAATKPMREGADDAERDRVGRERPPLDEADRGGLPRAASRRRRDRGALAVDGREPPLLGRSTASFPSNCSRPGSGGP